MTQERLTRTADGWEVMRARNRAACAVDFTL
jgi:hypothetical protein